MSKVQIITFLNESSANTGYFCYLNYFLFFYFAVLQERGLFVICCIELISPYFELRAYYIFKSQRNFLILSLKLVRFDPGS